jgi:hypothetical protein
MGVLHQLLVASILALAVVGCGPLTSPMPPRLDDNAQKDADASWNSAFTPADRLDHQALLDAFLISQAYQIGVDRLTMRSEKKLDSGMLTMEINFDRANPALDRFEVTLINPAGQQIRHELFTRADVEKTQAELFPPPLAPGANEAQQKVWARQNELATKRLEFVKNLLPNLDNDKKK